MANYEKSVESIERGPDLTKYDEQPLYIGSVSDVI